jgi:hypothetical protein
MSWMSENHATIPKFVKKTTYSLSSLHGVSPTRGTSMIWLPSKTTDFGELPGPWSLPSRRPSYNRPDGYLGILSFFISFSGPHHKLRLYTAGSKSISLFHHCRL